VLSRRTHASEGGFLLVEMLSAMAVMAVVVAGFSALVSLTTTRNATLARQAYLSTQGRTALDALSNQLESAMCNGTTQPITAASSTQIQFTAPDRLLPYHLDQYTYRLANGSLTRQVAVSTNTSTTGPPWTMAAAPAAATMLDSVTNSALFTYYDASGTNISPSGAALTSAQLPTVSRVTMTLTLVPLASRGAGSLTVQGSATIRTWTTQQACASS